MHERSGFKRKFYVGVLCTALGLSGVVWRQISKDRMDCTNLTQWDKDYKLCEGDKDFWIFDDRQNSHRIDGRFSNAIEVSDYLLICYLRDGSHGILFIKDGEEVGEVRDVNFEQLVNIP